MSNIINKLNRMQSKVVSSTKKSLKKKNKALLYMATGTGKTETAIKLAKSMNFKKILWLTHQTDLVEQTAERFINNGMEDVSLYMGGEKDISGQVVVATVQTIGRKNHLSGIAKNAFDAIFVDEAHHSPAEQWVKTIKHFNNVPRIGLTATPYRPDGKTTTEHETGVFDLFGEPIVKLRFKDAVAKGYLAKPISTVLLTNSVLEGLRANQEDWSETQLDKLYTSVERNDIIIKSYKEIRKEVKKPKAVCFCINIQHANRMRDLFRSSGIKAEFICSNSNYQSKSERLEVMEKYRTTDEIEVICAVNIFNEGVDIPEANIALMTRPTGSNIIYQQQVGRVARTNNGKKKEFHVIDFVDNTGREYGGYVLNNIYPRGSSAHRRIVTRYLTVKDPVAVKKRVADIMKRVMEFEDEQHREFLKIKNITEENLRWMIKHGKVDKRIYG